MIWTAIIKSLATVAIGDLTARAISPPHFASAQSGDRLINDSFSPEGWISRDRPAWVTRLGFLCLTSFEVWAIFKGPPAAGRLGWAEIAGLAIQTAGAALRLRCYQVLGRFFTFKISIRKEHRLIKGPFPYTILRHPSYTALYILSIGFLTRFLSPTNPLHLLFQINKVDLVSLPQEIFARTFGWALSRRTVALAEVVTTLILGTAVQIKMLGARVEVEEKALREEFGEEYDEYCRKTWRFFPGW